MVLEDLNGAAALDAADELAPLRDAFLFPEARGGGELRYFAGHSLGLQPRGARGLVLEALDDWAKFGVDGHFASKNAWMPYHELLTDSTARLVGALPHEVVVMNTLTVNVHLMLASFYRPTSARYKILIEGGAFPSDQYAVASQARWHGFEPGAAVVELVPRPGEPHLRDEDILQTIAENGEQIALILLGNCNYLTGQAYDIAAITRAGHERGCVVGFDLAHGAGNLELALHRDGPDFAVWCNYKYLNAGPGGLGGAFVHERHATSVDLPRLAGWWGHDKQTRFAMPPTFQPIRGAEGWQLSNPPILQLAALRASMELFDRAGMAALRRKSLALAAFLGQFLAELPAGQVEILTPTAAHRRGTMCTIRVPERGQALVETLHERGILVDLRNPDIVRIAPVALYTRFSDVAALGGALLEFVTERAPKC